MRQKHIKRGSRYILLHGRATMAELLLEKGADPNKVDEDGWTPLSVALKWHHMHTANVLRGVEGTKK